MEDLTRENYREYDAVNFSTLSQLDKNPSKVNSDEDIWNDGIQFGSLVDYFCFEPEKVDEEFYVSNASRDPSSTAKQLADWILNEPSIYCNINTHGEIQLSHDVEYGRSTLLLSDALDKAKEAVGKSTSFKKYGGVSYLREQIASKEKRVISQEEYDQAKHASRVLKTHEFTRDYFINNSSHIEIKNQVPILWEPSFWDGDIKNGPAKSLLDIVIIDHEEKTVLPVDLKTMSSHPLSFESSALKWKYYIQLSFYWCAVYQTVVNHDKIKEYNVRPFEFIVLGKSDINNPYVYTTTYDIIHKGIEGGIIKRWDSEVRGWVQLMKDLRWHQENDQWDYSREVYENNGRIELDIFE